VEEIPAFLQSPRNRKSIASDKNTLSEKDRTLLQESHPRWPEACEESDETVHLAKMPEKNGDKRETHIHRNDSEDSTDLKLSHGYSTHNTASSKLAINAL
jgi:hypothetical protein